MSHRTYAGAAKHLDRALTVAFYRTTDRLGIPRPNARRGVDRFDHGLQAIGLVYIVVTIAVVGAVVVLGWR